MDHPDFMSDQSKLWKAAFQRAPRKPDGGDWLTINEISEKMQLSRNVVRCKLGELLKNGQIERETFRIDVPVGDRRREIEAIHYRFKSDSGLKGIEPKSVNALNARKHANRRENKGKTRDELRRVEARCDALKRRFSLQKFTGGNFVKQKACGVNTPRVYIHPMKHKNTILEQTQNIGGNATRRVCLWNRKLTDAGFGIGTRIEIKNLSRRITITPSAEGARKVSRVINHGNELPVIDLKETRAISFAGWGAKVRVVIVKNKITITPTTSV